MGARAIDDLRLLARRDEELAAQAAGLSELDAECSRIRERAEAIDGFFARYPDEAARRVAAVTEARAELETRRTDLGAAQSALAAAKDEEARTYARHALERAEDHVRVADAALDRAELANRELEEEAAALPAEVPDLERRARAIAEQVAEVPAPGEGPRALVEWSSGAHAELFVAASQIATQRDAVIREANELATAVLAEPTYGSTVAQVVSRVENH